MEKTKVLMVCLGNICRSPLAQGIFESKVTDSAIVVDSAGTGSYHIGSAPDMRSIQVAQKNGIAIGKSQAGRQPNDVLFPRLGGTARSDRSWPYGAGNC